MAVRRCGQRNCWGNSTCKQKRECACRCGDLQGVNASLQEACVLSCQVDYSFQSVPTGMEWMMKKYDPVFLWQNYKIQVPGFDPLNDTFEGELLQDNQAREDQANSSQKIVIAVLGLLLVGLLVNLVQKF